MPVTANNTTKVATISGTTEAAPQSIESVIDAIVAVAPTEAGRSRGQGWIGGTWRVSYTLVSDALIISPYFAFELRDTALIDVNSILILGEASVWTVGRSAGWGFSGNHVGMRANGKLIARRRLNTFPPKIIFNCAGTGQRSDLFTGNNTSTIYDIQGLEVLYQTNNNGVFKVYPGTGSSINNLNAEISSGAAPLQFFSSALTEVNAPIFRGLSFWSGALTGDLATPVTDDRYVRLVDCVFSLSTSVFLFSWRNTAFVIIDATFTNQVPQSMGTNDGSAAGRNAPLDIRYTRSIKFIDPLGNSLANVRCQFLRSDSTNFENTSDANGNVSRELRWKFKPQGSTILSTFTWTIKARSYNYKRSSDTITSAQQIDSKISTNELMVLDTYLTISESQAQAITGIVINAGTSTITISEAKTINDVYHYYRWWISQFANFATNDSVIPVGDRLNFGAWSITVANNGQINEGITLKSFQTTGTVSTSGTGVINTLYQDSTRIYYKAITFIGFPIANNENGVAPSAVMGIKNTTTNAWTTYDASSGSVTVKLSALGISGQNFQVVADAVGWERTPLVSIEEDYQGVFDFLNLFQEFKDESGRAIVGKAPRANALSIDVANNRLEIEAGVHSFYGIFWDKEALTSGQTALTSIDTVLLRQFEFIENESYRVVIVPTPFLLAATPGATSAPILTDFRVDRDDRSDPIAHGLTSSAPGLTQRPEVQIRNLSLANAQDIARESWRFSMSSIDTIPDTGIGGWIKKQLWWIRASTDGD